MRGDPTTTPPPKDRAALDVLHADITPGSEEPLQGPGLPEARDAVGEEAADLGPAGGNESSRHRQTDADIRLPGCTGDWILRYAELESGNRPAGPDHAGQLGEGRRGIVDVAEEVRERERVERRVREGKVIGVAVDELDLGRDSLARHREHLHALVEAHHAATLPAYELDRDRAGARGDVEHGVARRCGDAPDEEAPPAAVLAEREQPRIAVVRRSQRREQADRVPPSLGEPDHAPRVAAPGTSASSAGCEPSHAGVLSRVRITNTNAPASLACLVLALPSKTDVPGTATNTS